MSAPLDCNNSPIFSFSMNAAGLPVKLKRSTSTPSAFSNV
ncbi:arsenic resistance operon repressor [Listeria monocytogenes]|nr:arsenic resistance operon repressor [Listeria monocytogenes]